MAAMTTRRSPARSEVDVTGVLGTRSGGGRKRSLLNITGQWELVRDRSESMYPHMKAMGCDEIAALASEKLNIMLTIVQTSQKLTIWQKSQLGTTTRQLKVNDEVLEKASQGDRHVGVSVLDDFIQVVTKFPRGVLTDTRTVAMEQEIPQGTGVVDTKKKTKAQLKKEAAAAALAAQQAALADHVLPPPASKAATSVKMMHSVLELRVHGSDVIVRTSRYFRYKGVPDPVLVKGGPVTTNGRGK